MDVNMFNGRCKVERYYSANVDNAPPMNATYGDRTFIPRSVYFRLYSDFDDGVTMSSLRVAGPRVLKSGQLGEQIVEVHLYSNDKNWPDWLDSVIDQMMELPRPFEGKTWRRKGRERKIDV